MGFLKSLGKAALGAVGGAVGGIGGGKKGLIGGAIGGAVKSLGGGDKGGGFSGPIKRTLGAGGEPSIISDDPRTGGISGRLGSPDIKSTGYGSGEINISKTLRRRDRGRSLRGGRR